MTCKVVEHAPCIETAVDQRGDNGLIVLVNVHERAGHGHGVGPWTGPCPVRDAVVADADILLV